MNRKVRKTFIGAFLATSLFMGVNSVSAVTIKETTVAENETLDKIANNTTIIGATKFEPSVVLTAMRIAKATTNDVYLNLNNPDYDGVKIYNYLFGKWYVLDENNDTRVLGQDEEYQAEDAITLEKLKEQAIYYVNNEEKVLEIEYSKDLEEGYTLEFRAGDKNLEYVDGKIQVPATTKEAVNVYAVKEAAGENPAVETKLDVFSRTSTDVSEFKTQSSLGSITYGDAKDASKITIDKINWVKAKEGKASGYYATVNIVVPEVYKNNYSNAKYYIDKLADEEQPKTLTESDLTQELTFDSETMSHTITVIWAEGNTQVFTVEATELSAKDGGTVSFGKTSSASELTIDNVEWYKAGEKGADAGNYATVTISTKAYATTTLKNDVNATYYIDTDSDNKTSIDSEATEITLKFDANTLNHTITVEWEKGNIQVFTVKATANGLENAPAGTLTKDNDTAANNFTFDSATNTATINGDIKWYSKGETTDYGKSATTAGNFKSVIINALGVYASSSSVNVKVYNGATKLSEENWSPSTSDAKYSLALNFAITKEYKVEVTWETGNVQTFTVKLGEKADVIAAPAGTITVGEKTSAGTLTISDEIAYSKAVTEGSAKDAGNYETVTINVPPEYRGKSVSVKIGEVTYPITTAGTTIAKELNFTTSKKHTIEVTWEEGNTQTFTVEATNVAAAPEGTIALAIGTEGLTLENGKLSGTVGYVKGEGNVINYVITAPTVYTSDSNTTTATITIIGYDKDKKSTTLVDKADYTFNISTTTYSKKRIVNNNFAYDEITIVWENGNKQVIKVDADNLELEARPNYIKSLAIASKGEDKAINTIIVGKTLDLEVTKTAEDTSKDITNPEVEWKSSNTSVATVDATGKVTAVGFGTTKITVSAKDGSGITAEYEITVNYAPIVDKTTYSVQGVTDNKIVTINFAAEGGAEKNDFVITEGTLGYADAIKKAFTYTYTIEKDGVKVEGADLEALSKYENNVLTLTIKDNAKYEVKYTISQKVKYAAPDVNKTFTTDELSKVVQEKTA